MEHFVVFPASVYNKSLNNESIRKKDFPKYQLLENPTYQIDPLKKEKNEKLYAEADSSVDEMLSCPHINLAN